MVNDLAGDNRDSEGDRRSQQLKGISMTLGLILSYNSVDATVNERGDLAIEMTNLLFDPFNFRPTAVEGMGGTGNHDREL